MQKIEKHIPDKKDLTSFLEKKIFKEPILSLYQFQRGSSSFNYLVTLQNKKVLVKLAWKYKKKGVERLVQIINLLSNQKDLPIAKILSFNNKNMFKYKNSYGVVLEYIEGHSPAATKITMDHIKKIIFAYKNIGKINVPNEKLLMPAYDFKQIQQTYLLNCEKMIKQTKIKFLFFFLLLKCKKNLIKIGNTPLKIFKDKKSIIHGDFHHNNLLFKNDKLVAILDLEDLGFGYKSEDLLRFIFCLIARQPIFYPKKKTLFTYLNFITEEFSYSKEEWLTGLNSFALQKYKKMFSKVGKSNFSNIKKMIQILSFMHRYNQVESYFKNLKNH